MNHAADSFKITFSAQEQFLQVKILLGSNTVLERVTVDLVDSRRRVVNSLTDVCLLIEVCEKKISAMLNRHVSTIAQNGPTKERLWRGSGYLKASGGLNRTWKAEGYSVGSRSWTLMFHLAACLVLDHLTLIHEAAARVIHRFQISKWESVDLRSCFCKTREHV